MSTNLVKAQFKSSLVMVRHCTDTAREEKDRALAEFMFRQLLETCKFLATDFGLAMDIPKQPHRPVGSCGNIAVRG